MLSDVKRRLEDLASRQEGFLEQIDPRRESRLLDFYVRIIPRMLDAERCSVFIHNAENRKVWLRMGTGVAERGIEVSLTDSIVGGVIASGKPVIANDMQDRSGTHRNIDADTGFVTREVICVPVLSRDRRKITGAIEVLNKKSAGGFNAEDRAFLEEAGEHLQSIVDSIYLSQEAVGMSKLLAATAVRATVVSFIALGVCILALVVPGMVWTKLGW